MPARIKTRFLFYITCLITSSIFNLPLSAQHRTMNAAELYFEITKLNTFGSVLYFAAHPDDENNALLSYFSREMKLRTGYLSLTRGDGGQNLIGTEKGALIGLIRTQELLKARQIEGTEQYFSRAIDFGYTKSEHETLEIWDHEKVLGDAVFVIRKFQPDIIITRFPTTGEGRHGQHTASAIIAEEAFEAAGDYDRFPEQLQYVSPWQPKRLFWNAWEQVLLAKGVDLATVPVVDAGTYNSSLGKSYTELGAESRSEHKSQAMGTAKRFGEWPNYFLQLKGLPVRRGLLDDVETSWRRIPNSEKVETYIQNALAKFDPQNRDKMLPDLIAAYKAMQNLPESHWLSHKKNRLAEIIRECAGLQFSAISNDYIVAPGNQLEITASVVSRSSSTIAIEKAGLIEPDISLIQKSDLHFNRVLRTSKQITIKNDAGYSQPYWMQRKAEKGIYAVVDHALTGMSESNPRLQARFIFSFNGTEIGYRVPVQYKWLDQRDGDKFRTVSIVPPVTVHFDEKVRIFPKNEAANIRITVTSNLERATGDVSLTGPSDWQISPSQNFEINAKYAEQSLIFTVHPPRNTDVAAIHAIASFQGKVYIQTSIKIEYDHIPVQTVLLPAELKAVRIPLKIRSKRIGYIAGAGDEIPGNLRSIGYEVEMLNAIDLDKGDLTRFDAIIAGVRAYNTRPELKQKNSRLLDYVKNGGTYVVQYNTSYALITEEIGPYPFKISRDRVTLEDAPMTLLDKNHPIFHQPNKITAEDFSGWVQERGLYFPNQWDERYRPLIACNDPGEAPTKGSLLYTKYGKGVFIYTGLSFFRELPAGVPGAYRLFVNLIEAGKVFYKK
ncbi:MAG: PIG-L family deacetylase [Calditrichaeota bacterium]|nr:MAG: PIG-L family deacetylase [Calditrichota bacterium]